MKSTNGAKHDVEDILASIRTSIADRSPLGGVDGAHRLNALRQPQGIADELPDFELPAIFKPATAQSAERPNLLGRLSEALSHNGEANADRSRTVIRFEPAHGRMGDPPQSPTRETSASVVNKVTSENDGMKREMPTFFDTRISRLGAMTKVEKEPPAEPPVRQASLSHPPRLPATSSPFDNSGMEDAAAQLLRPILKQWLMENMPKIVEKALRSEADQDDNGSSRR